MIEVNSFHILEEMGGERRNKDIDILYHSLLEEIQAYLNLEPINKKVQVTIIKSNTSNISESRCIFNIGVKRYKQNDTLKIEINDDYSKFLSFILLREVYNIFIPIQLRDHEIVQIVINKIILTQLSKVPFLNEWRSLIRGNLEDYDILSKGVNRLFEFDRLGSFLKSMRAGAPHDPIQFFFKYLREKIPIINDKIKEIHNIYFREFENYISKSINNDEIVETIRCLISIFYKVKSYTNIINYQKYFQEFKESGEIQTDQSLRKFIKNIDWMKKNSYIAPSYQLNWNVINVNLICVFLRFNPFLEKGKIYHIINRFPFFVAPKISNSSFAVDISGYVVIPNVYLDDFYRFIERLMDFGYILKHYCLCFNKHIHNVNLNYLRECYKKYRIINLDHTYYEKQNEIEFKTKLGSDYYKNELSLLDFLILDRIRFYSVSGLGFERRNDIISEIKSDLLEGIISERTKIRNLRSVIKRFNGTLDLKEEFLHFLESNQKFGFFFIKEMVETSINFSTLMEKVLTNNPNIKTLSQFQDIIGTPNSSKLIGDNILLKKVVKKAINFKELFNLYFQSRKLYKKEVNKLNQFLSLLNSCYELKIFNLGSIKKMLIDQKLSNKIYKTKEAKLKAYYEKWKLYKITFQEIENTIDKLLELNPPIIKPLLINTIIFDEKDYLQLVLIDSEKTKKIMKKVKNYFPRVHITTTECLNSSENVIYAEVSTPNMTKGEKEQFYSILYNLFKHNLLYGKSYLWIGWIPAISRKNFYNFDTKQFFYSKDLFNQFFLYIQQIFGEVPQILSKEPNKAQEIFWSKEKSFFRLMQAMQYYDRKENIDLTQPNLMNLADFNSQIKEFLLQPDALKNTKTEYFYKNYVKSIKSIPAFQHFGLEEFYLYVYPTEIESIDFKVLLSNTFQKIKYPACIDGSNSLLIKYLMPYHFPNKKYINWLSKAKKNIREYIAFSIRKVHRILQFNTNLGTKGWEYDPDKFKIYLQNILFNPSYQKLNPETQIFDLDEISDSKSFTHNSSEFKSLSKIYSWHSIDLKSYVGARSYSTESHIRDLLKKNLIFPYLSLRNLGIQDKLYIILPNLKKEVISKLIKIFNFFNIGFLYEIEGEFFISGFNNEIKFENGLMIKLYLPKCNIGEFEKLFDLLFQYLDITHYLILNDLVDGSNLIKSIYGDLNFLKDYNPLNNLKWSEKDKIWLNHNVLSKENGFICPDLIPKGSEKE